MSLRRAYEAALGSYPRAYRERFGAEMQLVFEKAAEECRQQGSAALLRFLLIEAVGLVRGAAVEWLNQIGGRSIPGNYLTPCDEIAAAQEEVNVSIRRMVHAIAHHDFAGARFYSAEEGRAQSVLEVLLAKRRAVE